jgi:ribosomal protein S18 acetylase RimI-like enzyme
MLRSLKDKISNILPSRTKDLVLREATKADTRFVFKLINQEIKEGHFKEWPSRRHKTYFKRYLRHALIAQGMWPRLVAPNPNDNVYIGARLWIGMNGMKRVGFISISEESPGSFEKSVEIWMVAVVPERRRNRFGKMMVDLVLDRMIEEMPKRRIIARCLPASHVMFDMLKRRGFRLLGTTPDGNRTLELKPKPKKKR